jgi:hypothetical protein
MRGRASRRVAIGSPTCATRSGTLNIVNRPGSSANPTSSQVSGVDTRALTLDIVYLPGHPYNNLLARLDRGRFCREEAGYVALAQRAGLRVVERVLEKSHPTWGLVKYSVLVLEP